MKNFKNNSELIHAYAQQNESNGQVGNLYFIGKELYSYGSHYLLCDFISDNTVLINDAGYSSTTQKHIGITMAATSQYKQFYTSESDLQTVLTAIEYNAKKLARANKPEIYISTIFNLWEKLNEFLIYTKAKNYKSNSDYKAIKKIVLPLKSNPEQYKEKLKELAIKQAKQAKSKAAKELKIKLVQFQSHEINSFRINNSDDFLRISLDKQFIETNQQVKIPIKAAKVLYKLIKEGKSIKGYNIDGYTVISINGTLKIGCHNINIKNVHEIGKKILGL